MSRIWSHYASITADRQSKHGISRVLNTPEWYLIPTISLPGYQTFTTEVDLAPNQKFNLKTDLLKAPAVAPPSS
jgi:hypothetical protein